MKRLVCMFLLALLILPTIAAADFDLSTLSNDELYSLEAKIRSEKADRGLPVSAVLTQGVYRIGSNGEIPSGLFTIVFVDSDNDSILGDYYSLSITVYDPEKEVIAMESLNNENGRNGSYTLYLPDNGRLDICANLYSGGNASVRLVKAEGVKFE